MGKAGAIGVADHGGGRVPLTPQRCSNVARMKLLLGLLSFTLLVGWSTGCGSGVAVGTGEVSGDDRLMRIRGVGWIFTRVGTGHGYHVLAGCTPGDLAAQLEIVLC